MTEEHLPYEGMPEEHPAYGTIQVGRIQGQSHLFGSEALHHSFIRVSIHTASIERKLSDDWIHPDVGSVVEVDMSEAQWGHFVSSHGLGAGTPCTIIYREGKRVPELPVPPSKAQKFDNDVQETMAGVLARLTDLTKQVADAQKAPSPRKSDLSAIAHELAMVRQDIQSNLPFVAKQFHENVEETMMAAKQEIEAFFLNLRLAQGLPEGAAPQAPLVLKAGGDDDGE